MPINTKLKLSNFAKDMGVKSKDLVELLKSKGFDGKSASSTLEYEETSIILQHYTMNSTVDDISSYLSPKKEEPKVEASEKKEPVKAETVSDDIKPSEVKAKAAEEKKSEAKKEEVKPESKPAVKVEVSKNEEKKLFEKKTDGQKPAFNQGERKPFDPNKKPFEKKPFDPNKKPFEKRPFGDNKSQQSGMSYNERQIEKQIGKIAKEGAALAKQEGRPVDNYPKFDKNERFDKYANVKFTKDGFVNVDTPKAAPQKPKFQKNSFNSNRDKDDENQSVRQPSLKPVYDKDGRIRSRYAGERIEGAQHEVDSEGKVVVDIRTSEVDLSKYDERLDNLVPDSLDNERGPKGNKKKAQGVQKGVGGKNIRNEAAARDFMPTFNGKGKKGKNKGAQAAPAPVVKFTGPITVGEDIMISDLASKLMITTGEVIKKLLMMGLPMDAVGANKIVDFDTAYLLADEMGIVCEREVVLSIEEKLFGTEEEQAAENEDNLVERSPVVCVMGHVDHGKTSLLDAIRNANVTAGEAGGITQHIGAYRVRINDRDITFLDTPGHEAFTAMRARGAQATDIAILVVAADDGIMPQTVEAINHAKAAGVSIIVAINKIDKPSANIDNVKQALANYELIPEEWGGDTICVPVSALQHKGIDELLEMVLLVADMKELKANPKCDAKGIVIEAKLDKGRGPVATVLVQHGVLHRGDVVIAGTAIGHVRAMTDYKGNIVKEAGPSVPVEITGLSEAPEGGDEFRVVADERMAKALVDERKMKAKEEIFKANAKVSLDTLFDQLKEGTKELAIIVKADVQGSAEAVKSSLEKLSNEEVRVKVIHSAAGGITENDVMLASASNAIVVGFNVRPDKAAVDSAEDQEVDIRTYRVIYECIEEITAAINGMLAPEFKEVVMGRAQVRQTIKVPGVGFIAGSY
ncbi:MAG: translation initiation factor IF-2, partial [Clostridia bacterium]|nr:translation initiation factor IF-2 [Clostridia bacterium]